MGERCELDSPLPEGLERFGPHCPGMDAALAWALGKLLLPAASSVAGRTNAASVLGSWLNCRVWVVMGLLYIWVPQKAIGRRTLGS